MKIQMKETAELIGQQSPVQRILVGLACPTLKGLVVPFDFAGYGRIGLKIPNLRLEWILCNDIDRLLFNSSTIVSLGDGAKARFRIIIGLMERLPDT
jgi:hypothetical protein